MINVILIESTVAERILIQSSVPEYCTVLSAGNVSEAKPLLSNAVIDVVITGSSVTGSQCRELLKQIPALKHPVSIIDLKRDGEGDVSDNPSVAGLDIYSLMLPDGLAELSGRLRKIVNKRLEKRTAGCRYELSKLMSALVGSSEEIMGVKSDILNLSNAPGPVLITGESGTGKEIIARLLHDLSERSSGPFHAVNAGAIPSGLSMTELFGSNRGAFTGAVDRSGYFEHAEGGTLFLDEIAEVEPSVQVELLRVLETKKVKKIGGNRLKKIDVRLISATNKNLKREAGSGRFRKDLLYRIDVFRIQVPPLRDRKEDIPDLLMHFSSQLRKERPNKQYVFSDSFIDKLFEHNWPGNVRELRNVFRRAVYASDSEVLTESCISYDF